MSKLIEIPKNFNNKQIRKKTIDVRNIVCEWGKNSGKNVTFTRNVQHTPQRVIIACIRWIRKMYLFLNEIVGKKYKRRWLNFQWSLTQHEVFRERSIGRRYIIKCMIQSLLNLIYFFHSITSWDGFGLSPVKR